MKALSQLGKKKNAVSNIIGYVLLITISISLSVLVYGWLKFYVSEDDIETCPDSVNLIIKSYECVSSVLGGADGYLTVILKNKGLFGVDGYILRVHDRPDADFGFYTFDDVGVMIKPGEEYSKTYYFAEYDFDGKILKEVTLVEAQPFITNGDNVSCEAYTFQKIECQ